jgi:hypothetical protein
LSQIRAPFAFSFTGFATIEVEERIEVHLTQNPKAIRFRSERLRNPKTALLDRLSLRDGACINIILNNLWRKMQPESGFVPPVACKTVNPAPSRDSAFKAK